jgi:protein-disulfide isomerase
MRLSWLIRLAALLLPMAAMAQPAFTPAQRAEIVQILRDAMKQDTTILRDAVAALQAEEERQNASVARSEIEKLADELTRSPADQVAGNPKGDVTIVEFYDVRCPYCRRMLPVIAQLLKADPGIRLVYKDLPVLGPGSVLGARALIAAQKQDGYLKLHDILMTGSPNIDRDTLRAAAQHAGLDWAKLDRDMQAPEVQARIDTNLAVAHRLQIEGTPAYVLGGQLLPGAMDLQTLQDAVSLARK